MFKSRLRQDFEQLIKDFPALEAACQHDSVTRTIEEATTRGGMVNERIVKVEVYTCDYCGDEL